jgi:uncharacterized protein (TIGR02147 family)
MIILDYFRLRTSLEILQAKINQNQNSRGYKALLANAAGCQRSFLSLVLTGKHILTQEHGIGLATYWGMTSVERDFFLQLINFERAGTEALRNFYQERIDSLRKGANDLATRFQVDSLPLETMSIYYSTWLYPAVHMLLTVPSYQTTSSLSERLKLPTTTIKGVLDTLVKLGIIEESSKRFETIKKVVHLPKNSPLNQTNHGNWRQYSVNKSVFSTETDVHYTAVYSLSNRDKYRLQNLILEFIERTRQLVAPSAEEDVVAVLIDYFTV